MTDEELLNVAAKAAGYWSHEYGCASDLPRPDWNPLADDGDALRLAVKLKIEVSPSYGSVTAGTLLVTETMTNGTDPYAATRRAIVHAAAAMANV